MEPLKDAFSKVKQDVEFLNNEISFLREELIQTREELIKICNILINLDKKITETGENKQKNPENQQKNQEKHPPTHQPLIQTSPTHNPTHNPTHLLPLEALKSQNKPLSTGNEGVPTDKQTHQQTDKEPQNQYKLTPLFPMKAVYNPFETTEKFQNNTINTINAIDNAAKILDSLDSIKKEIRLKFKRLTSQEMIVFSTLYQIEEESGQVDYKILAKKLNLTESSVRDYIGRLIKKGIPVEKKRINNKTILLSVSANLKKITSLSTIMQLRDL
jgi:DNA-binding MarR family transcriptional regulator